MESHIDGRCKLRAPSREAAAMQVTLHTFPDLGLIEKAGTGVIYSNQTGGFACWIHVRLSGKLDYKVPLRGSRPDALEAVLTWPNSD